MEKKTRLIFTYWGSYLDPDTYADIGINIAQMLMKYWGEVKRLEGSEHFSKRRPIDDINSLDRLKEIILQRRSEGDYEIFDVTYFNPTVTEEIYVNRLEIGKYMMSVKEYDNLKFFRTSSPEVNEHRTEELLKVFTDIANHPSIRECWMGDDWNAFMGEPAFLYRPESLQQKIGTFLYTLKVRNEVLALVDRFHTHVPTDLVIRFIQNRLGQEAVREMGNNKILVKFYDRELTKLKVNPWDFLKEYKRHVDEYLLGKGIRLYSSS
ncbi:hypothetical protein [Lihuaxuella thermophila]|uniref:Uncharacterized protein n=1 Tax=Lihuaxuella thermophila TaxID=1173111 RepID=A0A1H8BLW9_9BACL|nr:hypothetical protein [Lihuaxuella thermophila]SEM83855.1 hypothetical protein SAMN05444955_102258 [Lihuaxuella thermophila]